VGRPTTAGLDVPEQLAQVTYPATVCEREGDTLPTDLDPPDPIQRNYLIYSSGTHTSKGIQSRNQPFFDSYNCPFERLRRTDNFIWVAQHESAKQSRPDAIAKCFAPSRDL
jgi:hypothetical protein